MGVGEIIGYIFLGIFALAVLIVMAYCAIRDDMEENAPKKYDEIHDKEKVMNKRERIEKLEEEIAELKELKSQYGIKLYSVKKDAERYSKALFYLSKFSFSQIKNKALRKETESMYYGWSIHYGNALCASPVANNSNIFDKVVLIKDILKKLDQYDSEVIIAIYGYIIGQVDKDKDLSKYIPTSKRKA